MLTDGINKEEMLTGEKINKEEMLTDGKNKMIRKKSIIRVSFAILKKIRFLFANMILCDTILIRFENFRTYTPVFST